MRYPVIVMDAIGCMLYYSYGEETTASEILAESFSAELHRSHVVSH